jgi:hypothetical protein
MDEQLEQQIEQYLRLLKELISLQQKLISTLEAVVKIEPIPEYCAGFIDPQRTISEIMRDWPDRIMFPHLFQWIKPSQGRVQLQESYWHFYLNGVSEIRFRQLPSNLDTDVLRACREGRANFLSSVFSTSTPDTTSGRLLEVDVTYVTKGQTDAVRAWAVYLFAQSLGGKLSRLSQQQNKELLEKLVEKKVLQPIVPGVLVPLPGLGPGEDDRYFAFV